MPRKQLQENSDDSPDSDFASLYPDLVPQRLQEAEEHFETYIEHSLVMYERIRQDPEAYRQFRALTGRASSGYDELGRTPPNH